MMLSKLRAVEELPAAAAQALLDAAPDEEQDVEA
jgi:hypothetical protein